MLRAMGSPIDQGVIVVTGASSGIGREFARLLASRASVLVLVARRKERLDKLKRELTERHAELTVHVEPCDLSDRTSTEDLLRRIDACAPEVDVLINNAGIGDMGIFDRCDRDKQVSMIELNVVSVVLLTHHLLGPMVERKRGAVLNVSSGFGLSYLPGFASYVGTKHFVTGFTDSLRAELSGTGVFAGQLCPGPVATEFEQNVGNFTGQKVPSFIEISPERCAKAGIGAIDGRRGLKIPGLLVHAVLLLSAYTPRFLTRWVLALVGRNLRKRQLAAQATS